MPDDKYQQLVQSHKQYLKHLQQAFDSHCEAISKQTKEQLAAADESDTSARERILKEEQAELDKALSELRQVVGRTGAELRSKLEMIEKQREERALNLERELSNL